jgi:hypothetical protein
MFLGADVHISKSIHITYVPRRLRNITKEGYVHWIGSLLEEHKRLMFIS